MPYSDKHKVFWFHPMRTASRATDEVLEYLKFSDVRNHSYIRDINHLEYTFISNIRNPYSRVVSIYNLRRYENEEMNFDFQLWVKRMIQSLSDQKRVDWFNELSIGKIFHEYKKFPEFYVRVETLEEDLMKIDCVKDNYDSELDRIFNEIIRENVFFNPNRISWKDMYTQDLADMVYEYCEKDFLYFNYDKNSWKNGTP